MGQRTYLLKLRFPFSTSHWDLASRCFSLVCWKTKMWVFYATSSALIKIMNIWTCNICSEENKTKQKQQTNTKLRSFVVIRQRGPLSCSTGSREATLLPPSYKNTAGDHGLHRGGWGPAEHTRSQERLPFPHNFSVPIHARHPQSPCIQPDFCIS